MTTQGHTYRRDVFSAHAESLSKLSARMVRGSEVLELGPAAGYFTRILKSSLGCKVDAIEIDEAMATQAREHCRDLIVHDLDTLDWFNLWPQRRYDTIIAADVLEHLCDPERTLRALRSRLKPGGKLLISLPNIAYAGMFFGLLEDDFRYRAEGLLDRTHLRFFTRTTLNETLARTGWGVTWSGEVGKDVYEAEFHTRLEQWPAALREYVMEHPQRRAYQLLCECAPAPVSAMSDSPAAAALTHGSGQFAMRMMWAQRAAEISFDHGAAAFAALGKDNQRMEWTLPTAARVVRFRLTDRPGFLRLHKIEWKNGQNLPTPHPWQAVSLSACRLSDDATATEGSMVLGSAESWLELPEGDYPAGARFGLECGWPMSADYVQAQRACENSRAQIQLAHAECARQLDDLRVRVAQRESTIEARDALLSQTNAHVLHLERIAAERAQIVQTRDRQLDELNAARQEIETLLQQSRQEASALSAQSAAQQTQIAQQASQIAALRSFRQWWRHRFAQK
jgi:O-antigen biosynthesis protein